jgi:hypothetical protein
MFGLAMLRPLVLLAVMATALSFWGGTAHAWRMVCEAEATVEEISPPADDDRAAVPLMPIRADVCIAGASDDPSCWPSERLPVRGGHLFFGSSQLFGILASITLPAGPSPGRLLDTASILPLAEGHERRLERPPRVV